MDVLLEAKKIAGVAILDQYNADQLGITREEYQRRRQENLAWMRAKAKKMRGNAE